MRRLFQQPVNHSIGLVTQIGQQAVQNIYAAIQRAARTQIEAIEREARLQVQTTQKARAEAELEIERLELQALTTENDLANLRANADDLRGKAERADGQLAELTKAQERSQAQLETLGNELKGARDELAEQRGRLGADVERAKTEIARLREQLKPLQSKRLAGLDKPTEGSS